MMEMSLDELLEKLDSAGSQGLDLSPGDPVALTAAYLLRGLLRDAYEIEQLAGKALGYPWYKDDQKNFPGTTEKDGVCIGEHVAASIVAELAHAYEGLKSEYERLKRGEFTKEEIHDFCHNLSDRVGVEEFAEGCAGYQRKLYGRAPDAEAAFVAEVAIMKQGHTEPGSFVCRWRERENFRHTPLIAACTSENCIWVRLQTTRPAA